MSSTEKETKEPKIDEKTGLPEGLDPGESYETHSPEERSQPIPTTFGSRLVGKTAEEAEEILAKEKKERDEAVKAEEDAQKAAETSASKTTTSKS